MGNEALAQATAAFSRDGSSAATGNVVSSGKSRFRGLGVHELAITGGFWQQKQQLNAESIIAHCEQWMERIGWLANFDLVAAGAIAGSHRGIEFVDSEVYKLLEAMAWELGRMPDAALEARFDAIVRRVAAAQSADGYLNTSFGHPGEPARYSNLADGHELYCFGHLLQAAVARIRTGHDDLLVSVARRAADHLVAEFGEDGRDAVCGHPEIEMALVELGRALDDRRYVELAALFVERRGHGLVDSGSKGSVYYVDDLPVRDARVLRGHAVRALYLAAGALDVATEQADIQLASAVAEQWSNTTRARSYVTGGMGARHEDESFGLDWELPPDRAYAETCAGVASVMLSWRLLLTTGDDKYSDLIERTLLNNVLASPREDGHAFFYANTLHMREPGRVVDETQVQERADSGMRAPWFSVSCCPTNVARTLASVSCYFATADGDGIQLRQYGDYDVATTLGDDKRVSMSVRSGLPFDGGVDIEITGERPTEFTLALRIPAWATGATVTGPDGEDVPVAGSQATVRRVFQPGDRIRMSLPTAPKIIWPHPHVDANRGQVAVERGPLVLALESVDLPSSVPFDDLELDLAATPRATTRGAIVTMKMVAAALDAEAPYATHEPAAREFGSVDVELHPYSEWANRGPSRMRVWIPHRPIDSP